MSESAQQRSVNRSFWIYTLLLVLLTACAWSVYAAHHLDQVWRPFFDKTDQYKDLQSYAGKIAHLHEGGKVFGQGLPKFNYPAPAAYVYAFFLLGFPGHGVRVLLLVILVGIVAGGLLWIRAVRATSATGWGVYSAILATVLLGSPLLFAADRANLEAVVALVLAAGLLLFVNRHYYRSAIFIGLATSIKPFPGLFLLLLLRKGRYREAAVGLVVAIATIFLALTALGPTPVAAYKDLQPGVKLYVAQQVMAFPPRYEGRFEHSIMDCLKSVSREWTYARHTSMANLGHIAPTDPPMPPGEPQPPPLFPNVHTIYLVSVALEAVVFVFILLRAFKMPTLNQMVMVGIAITLLPPIAAEYTLLHLYVPFAVLTLYLVRDVASGSVIPQRLEQLKLLALFAVLFSPVTFLGKYAGDAKTLTLLLLLYVISTVPLPTSIFQEL